MPRRQKKHHFIYRTTNTSNSKFYVGMHSTDDLDDGYMGSGKYLWNSIRKHGRENFRIELLEFFDSREELKEREKELVDDEMLKDPLCMNLMKGGVCGFDYINMKRNNDPEFAARLNVISGNILKKCHEQGKIKYDTFTGRKHKQKTKNKMSKKAHLRTGDKNSQFGTCWIYNLKENKKIRREELDKWISIGWSKGRKTVS